VVKSMNMFLTELVTNPVAAVFFLVSIILAVDVHEFCHAKAADVLGDPTPESMGRLTLNPLAHLDPFGSLLFLFIGFGWGKPVPFDPYNLENPRRDAGIIACAGPASNFVMAIAAALLLAVSPVPLLDIFLSTFIWINIVLGIFNLLPISPLDGFKIFGGILPEEQADQWYSLERYGMIFLLFFIFPFVGGRSMLEVLISPVIRFLVSLLIPQPATLF